MTLAVNVTDGHGLSNEARHGLLQGNAVFAVGLEQSLQIFRRFKG